MSAADGGPELQEDTTEDSTAVSTTMEEEEWDSRQASVSSGLSPAPPVKQASVRFDNYGDPTTASTSQVDSDAQFAAVLTAKLYSLDSVRGSPEPLEEYENPSSMETQGDALCNNSGPPSVDSLDPADLEQSQHQLQQSPNAYVVPDCPSASAVVPPSSYMMQYGPVHHDPSIGQLEALSVDDTMTGALFAEDGDSGGGSGLNDAGDVSSESAEAGVCGLRNLGNTCFMNSGLQCVLATPSILDFFLNFSPEDSFKDLEKKNNTGFALSKTFAALTKQIYSGQYSVVQPTKFKDTLSESHSQFKGFRQHDCQEFLALLLDSLHEQLVHIQPVHKGPMSECTSMELHTPHSTEVSCDGKELSGSVFSFGNHELTSGSSDSKMMMMMMLDKDADSVSDLDRQCPGPGDLESVSNLEPNLIIVNTTGGGGGDDANIIGSGDDGMESRGSASPKSYTSHSSLEENSSNNAKFPASIRMAPIPECIRMTAAVSAAATSSAWNEGSRASIASLDSHTTESDLELGDEDSVGGSSMSSMVTSNLVPADQLLKKKQVVFSDTNLLHGNSRGGISTGDETLRSNNAVVMNVAIEDFLKEHKTLNVNMNVITEEGQAAGDGSATLNNRINFDSEKFARHGYQDNTRPAATIENLNNRESANLEKSYNVKRLKCCNMEIEEGLELTDQQGQGSGDKLGGKRIRLDSSTEKNILMETERRESEQEVMLMMESQTEPPSCYAEAARDPARLKEAIEADRYWERYLASNSTVMAHTFQGQFKNTVKCSECGHVSVSFEPFMYLSVPLPRANDIQIEVRVVLSGEPVSHHLLTLSRHDTIREVRSLLLRKLKKSEAVTSRLVFAEVTRHKITRQLEDTTWLKFVNSSSSTTRQLYAMELLTLDPEETLRPDENSTSTMDLDEASALKLDDDCGGVGGASGGGGGGGCLTSYDSLLSSLSSSRSDLATSTANTSNTTTSSSSTPFSSSASTSTLTETGTLTEGEMNNNQTASSAWKSCNICLEEMADSDLVTHIQCTCLLCRDCLERSMKHQEQENGGVEKCPVCLEECQQSEWLQLDRAVGVKPPLRMLTIPVVFQHPQEGEIIAYTNVGHPRLLRVPNCLRPARLRALLAGALPPTAGDFSLALLEEATDRCARCQVTERCRGCPLGGSSQEEDDSDTEILLKPSDRLALRLKTTDKGVLDELARMEIDSSMLTEERLNTRLHLYDCLQAFSSREELDQNNPWFCPVCRRHQTATKTLSVWRYPDFLIIILKRFVYLERGPGGVAGSVKLDNRVEFPLQDLDLNPYLSGPLQQGGERFELYASISHFGSLSSGHYTAFAKHPITRVWHYFNDSLVELRSPEGEAQDDAYVLFYRRSGLPYSLQLPEQLNSSLWNKQQLPTATAADPDAELEEEVALPLEENEEAVPHSVQ